MYDMSTGRKTVSVKRLASLLTTLPEQYMLEVNNVGNLLITYNDWYIGFVDFNEEKVEFMNPGDEED